MNITFVPIVYISGSFDNVTGGKVDILFCANVAHLESPTAVVACSTSPIRLKWSWNGPGGAFSGSYITVKIVLFLFLETYYPQSNNNSAGAILLPNLQCIYIIFNVVKYAETWSQMRRAIHPSACQWHLKICLSNTLFVAWHFDI